MPQVHGDLIIKENLGKGSRRGDEGMTADNEGESKLTELLSMPKVWRVERKALTWKQGVLKNTAMFVLSELRSRPCDRCKYAGCIEGAGGSSFSVQVVVLPVKIVRRKVVI